ncbi:hypothetical protein [Rhizobium indigoferae]|uniref:hypothetical protein n=1 Tax=Rhizobium indigoferae TaxID=158891 RepID=UPI001FE4A798|nr:hypothetical protein [Rhizobium indigoferae]GLR60439.1 hypothetical protein GCM10007919_51680 [Rhizobium indigoferae]
MSGRSSNHVTGADFDAAFQAPVVVNLRVHTNSEKGHPLAFPVQLAALAIAVIDKFLGLDVGEAESAENDEIAVVGGKQSVVCGGQ